MDTFFKKFSEDAWAYLEENAEYAKRWVDTNDYSRTEARGGMHTLKAEDDLQARVTADGGENNEEPESRERIPRQRCFASFATTTSTIRAVVQKFLQ